MSGKNSLEKNRFKLLIKNPFSLKKEDLPLLEKIIKKFPYFQACRILYLKCIKELPHANYLNELKITSIYCSKRSVLFNYMKYEHLPQKPFLEPGLGFKKYTLSQWLKIGNAFNHNSKERESPSKEKKLNFIKLEAIDNFLNNYSGKSSRIINPGKEERTYLDKHKIIENENIVTETLAQIYLNQSKYKKAIRAYEVLSIKYPEKNDFFATKISSIKEMFLSNL